MGTNCLNPGESLVYEFHCTLSYNAVLLNDSSVSGSHTVIEGIQSLRGLLSSVGSLGVPREDMGHVVGDLSVPSSDSVSLSAPHLISILRCPFPW